MALAATDIVCGLMGIFQSISTGGGVGAEDGAGAGAVSSAQAMRPPS